MSASAPAGTSATRFSLVLISLGTPIFMAARKTRGGWRRAAAARQARGDGRGADGRRPGARAARKSASGAPQMHEGRTKAPASSADRPGAEAEDRVELGREELARDGEH